VLPSEQQSSGRLAAWLSLASADSDDVSEPPRYAFACSEPRGDMSLRALTRSTGFCSSGKMNSTPGSSGIGRSQESKKRSASRQAPVAAPHVPLRLRAPLSC